MIVNKRIEFNDVRLKAKLYKRHILQAITKVIDKGVYFSGSETKKLQKKLAAFFKQGYITTTASGHDALFLALHALNLQPSDEVIVPVNAYPTVFPIAQSGAKVVFVDCDNNGQMSAQNLAQKISARTKVVVLVHLYGLVGDISKIKKLLKGKKITLIEDCAQSFGTVYKGKIVGTLGDIGCFSFYPTKNLATLGDAGALWTKNKKFYSYFTMATMYGESKRYKSQFVAGHSRIPEIQAAILVQYFKKIKSEIRRRRALFRHYQTLLADKRLKDQVRLLHSTKVSNPAVHLCVVAVKRRNDLRAFLKKRGISTHVHYPVPVHFLPTFSNPHYKKGTFSQAEWLSEHIVSLPFHPHMTKKHIEHIVKLIKNFYAYV